MVCEACGCDGIPQHVPTLSWIWERESMENSEPFMKILETALFDSVEPSVVLTAPEPARCRPWLLRGLHPAIS